MRALTQVYEPCKRCQVMTDTGMFVKSKNDRRGYIRVCLACRKIENQAGKTRSNRAKNAKRDLINKIKDVPCTDCGVKYPSYVMDLDHLPGFEKKFSLGQYAFHSMEDILEEIRKCEVVCSNCHRIRTHGVRPTKGD